IDLTLSGVGETIDTLEIAVGLDDRGLSWPAQTVPSRASRALLRLPEGEFGLAKVEVSGLRHGDDCQLSSGTGRVAAPTPGTYPPMAALLPLPLTGCGVRVSLQGGGRVRSEPPGIDCGETCDAEFRPGTPVRLIADACADTYFLGWTGGCQG